MTEIQTIIENFNGGLDIMNTLITTINIAIVYGLIIFLISTIVGLFINRDNKNIVLNKLMDILKYCYALLIMTNIEFIADNSNHTNVLLILIGSYLVINLLLVFGYKSILNKRNEVKIKDCNNDDCLKNK